MRIGFIEPHLKLYGGIRRIVELSNQLTERGHDVTIYHSDGSQCQWMKCIAETKSSNDVLKQSHDVIIYNDPNPIDYELAKKADAKLKVFYVLALYERPLLKGFNPKIYLPWHKRMLLLKKSLTSPCLKLANSSWIHRWLKEHMGIHSRILIGGINREIFHPVEVERNPSVIRILCSGDPRERKGTQTVLEAVEMAKKDEPRIVLDTYSGKDIPQSKIAEVYSSADIFVDGQWYAGWNNPVAEAMACRVPVVCTDIGGVQDFAFHRRTALLVPPKDPTAMASAILWLIGDEQLRETLRENAYEHIQQFDWGQSARKLEEILTSELTIINFNPSYTGSRDDIAGLIPSECKKILDVGCGVGALGETIKQRNGAEVVGIELNTEMAEIAGKILDRVVVGDLESVRLEEHLSPAYFDCMIFADVLEHLRDPWAVLRDAVRFLNRGGVVVASIPNVRHYTTILNVAVKGRWPYDERGICDRTHLRFFTLTDIEQMFQNAGLRIVRLERKYRIIERPHPYNRISKYLAWPPFRDFLTFQYLILAKKSP
jgi:glycosyltransferase involved in cell wall biosynthesis/ubiquinone/menaquinone biosynthesis C-methylase UbiE